MLHLCIYTNNTCSCTCNAITRQQGVRARARRPRYPAAQTLLARRSLYGIIHGEMSRSARLCSEFSKYSELTLSTRRRDSQPMRLCVRQRAPQPSTTYHPKLQPEPSGGAWCNNRDTTWRAGSTDPGEVRRGLGKSHLARWRQQRDGCACNKQQELEDDNQQQPHQDIEG